MSKPDYELKGVEINLEERKLYLNYQNSAGGTIILQNNGQIPEDWTGLPDNFPIEHAKSTILSIIKG